MIVVVRLVMLGVAVWRFAATKCGRYAPRPVCCRSASIRSDRLTFVRRPSTSKWSRLLEASQSPSGSYGRSVYDLVVLTDRIRVTVERDYTGEAIPVAYGMLARLGAELSMWREVSEGDRVERAALIYAHGDLDRLRSAVDLALRDWRDLLVAVGGA